LYANIRFEVIVITATGSTELQISPIWGSAEHLGFS